MQCAFCLVKGIFLHTSHYFAGKKSCLILIKAALICIMAGSYEPFHLIKHTHCIGYHITLTLFCPFSIYHYCNMDLIIITKLLCLLPKIRNYLMRLRSLNWFCVSEFIRAWKPVSVLAYQHEETDKIRFSNYSSKKVFLCKHTSHLRGCKQYLREANGEKKDRVAVEKTIKSLFKGMIKQVASQSRYFSYISNPIATKTKPKMTQISFTLTTFGWSILRHTLGNHCVLRSPFV